MRRAKRIEEIAGAVLATPHRRSRLGKRLWSNS
jgi:hypothetical protein